MNENQSSVTWQKTIGFLLMSALVIASAYLAWVNVQMQRHMNVQNVQMDEHMDENDMDMHNEDSTTPSTPPTPSVVDNDTSDWRSYIDSEYGYAFKYPSDWKVKGHSFSGPEGTLNVNVNLQALGFECYENVNSHGIIYDGYDGVDSIFQGVNSEMCDESGMMIEWTTLSVGDNVYDISFTYEVENEDTAVPLFGRILDTFEFPDVKDTVNTSSDMQIFTSDRYSYQIEYPVGGVVSFADKNEFSVSEITRSVEQSVPEDFNDAVDYLYKKYTKEICVRINYGGGYISISAPTNRDMIVLCQPTGVGVGAKKSTQNVNIDGVDYVATGYLTPDSNPSDNGDDRSENLVIRLDNGTVLAFGSRSDYASYLETKPDLIKIIESYKSGY